MDMASSVDDLTVEYMDGGVVTVKELDKVVLSKGAWATLLFRYRDWDHRTQRYGPDRYTIRRYQKRSGEYYQKSKFNISSREQAEKIIKALQTWLAEPED